MHDFESLAKMQFLIKKHGILNMLPTYGTLSSIVETDKFYIFLSIPTGAPSGKCVAPFSSF